MRLRFGVLAVLLATTLAGPALAHQPVSVPEPAVALDAAPAVADTLVVATTVAPTIDALVVVAVALGFLGLVWLRRVPRRALVLAVVLCLGIVAFEGGVHSVHHLGEAQASCPVAAGTAQLHGTAPPPVADVHLLVPAERLVSSEPVVRAGSLRPPTQGRAPPTPA